MCVADMESSTWSLLTCNNLLVTVYLLVGVVTMVTVYLLVGVGGDGTHREGGHGGIKHAITLHVVPGGHGVVCNMNYLITWSRLQYKLPVNSFIRLAVDV